jgi:cyclopropane-fatty-acyl-phospholipid synthase
MLKNQITKQFLETFEHLSHGVITITMPDGKHHEFSGEQEGTPADLTINDLGAITAFAQKGDIGFAQSYREGGWDSSDLTALFLFGLNNAPALDTYLYGGFLARIASRLAYYLSRNTLGGSKKNIHAHYDLGNDFYSLWLDASMTYSSAIFADKNETLLVAQQRKYDRIIERLGSSGSLLEIGCGWGGFAERALESHDFTIKGLTISKAQHDFATQRLANKAVISLEDYRHEQAIYDHIVSIEMFEAVGESYWPVYFSQIKALLAKNGKAMIQTITIEEQHFERYKKGGDPIRTFIFPGGMLPSPERFKLSCLKAGLVVTDEFSFGNDYALTLKVWLAKFEQNLDQVKALGFDEAFIRMWRFYLNYCIASFTVGRTNVMQMEVQHLDS